MGLYNYRGGGAERQCDGNHLAGFVGRFGSGRLRLSTSPTATQGLGVSLPASVPEVTAVGGTEFNEGSLNYWSGSNGLYGGSALSYIPETAWNDTAASERANRGERRRGEFGLQEARVANRSRRSQRRRARCARRRPGRVRTLHDPYLIVSEGAVFGVGGTSAAAPSFAGMIAVLNQYLVQNKVQTKPGVGNINPKLYAMAAGGTSGVFHDVTTGNNIVPCQAGTPNCTNGQFGYTAGVGYDLVTGLGSVDAYNLITAWGGIPVTSTTTTLTASPATYLGERVRGADRYREGCQRHHVAHRTGFIHAGEQFAGRRDALGVWRNRHRVHHGLRRPVAGGQQHGAGLLWGQPHVQCLVGSGNDDRGHSSRDLRK